MEQCRLPTAHMKESKRAAEGFESLDFQPQKFKIKPKGGWQAQNGIIANDKQL